MKWPPIGRNASSGAYRSRDQAHVAEDVRVAGEVEAEAVLELDDEPDRLAEIERRLGPAVESPAEWSAADHRDAHAGCLDGAALVHPDHVVRAGVVPAEPEAHLVHGRPGWIGPAGERRARPRSDRSGRASPSSASHRSTASAALGLVGLPNQGSNSTVRPLGVSSSQHEWPYQVNVASAGQCHRDRASVWAERRIVAGVPSMMARLAEACRAASSRAPRASSDKTGAAWQTSARPPTPGRTRRRSRALESQRAGPSIRCPGARHRVRRPARPGAVIDRRCVRLRAPPARSRGTASGAPDHPSCGSSLAHSSSRPSRPSSFRRPPSRPGPLPAGPPMSASSPAATTPRSTSPPTRARASSRSGPAGRSSPAGRTTAAASRCPGSHAQRPLSAYYHLDAVSTRRGGELVTGGSETIGCVGGPAAPLGAPPRRGLARPAVGPRLLPRQSLALHRQRAGAALPLPLKTVGRARGSVRIHEQQGRRGARGGRRGLLGYTRRVPAERIAENLAFINWTVLTASRRLVRGRRPRRSPDPGDPRLPRLHGGLCGR